ncbi:MAG: putative enzyme [Promethearchaeota archaeon]|nr:MAG: putative enzyme [Candidatus Lokiarchaeota archaeon]
MNNDKTYEAMVIERQKNLSKLLGVSGNEEKVVKFIIEEVKDTLDDYWVDDTGNLLGVIKGPSKSPAILLDAHTDEIGFMITHIDDNGFSYFTPIGGWDNRILLGQNVIVEPNGERIYGVIGAVPPHITKQSERKELVPMEKMFIDFGFQSKKELEKEGIQVGTVGTLYSGFQKLKGGKLKGKAFDDRSGCNILMQTALNLKEREIPYTVCFAWSAQEEVGIRGARTSAYAFSEKFDIIYAIAVENTTAADVPGVPPQRNPTKMGEGPAITIIDSSTIASPKVKNHLIETAENKHIPYQIKTPSKGGTDAGAIHLTQSGIAAGIVSVPGRYIHSPCTIIHKDDLLNSVRLITESVIRKF